MCIYNNTLDSDSIVHWIGILMVWRWCEIFRLHFYEFSWKLKVKHTTSASHWTHTLPQLEHICKMNSWLTLIACRTHAHMHTDTDTITRSLCEISLAWRLRSFDVCTKFMKFNLPSRRNFTLCKHQHIFLFHAPLLRSSSPIHRTLIKLCAKVKELHRVTVR